MRQRWIQGAVKRPGALTKQMREKYGSKAFTQRGTIKVEYLNKAAKEPGKLGQRARFARNVRK